MRDITELIYKLQNNVAGNHSRGMTDLVIKGGTLEPLGENNRIL